MKKLTFYNQIFLGIIGLGLGHLFSWFTSNGMFRNLGWIFYGFLFLAHPVLPERQLNTIRWKNRVRFIGALIMLMGCLVGSGSGADFWQSRISDTLGIDTTKATVVESYDDQSGFPGDGTMYAVLSFEDDELEKAISAPGGWYILPLTENLQTLLYGITTGTSAVGPFIGVTMPEVERGYWFFYDRLGETHNDSDVLKRGSFNYTAAIYDADNDLLYYCEFDA